MSSISILTQKIAALTTLVNGLITNAKKIDELPAETYLNPSSKVHISINGVSKSLSVYQLINAVRYGLFNQLISIGDLTLIDNEITVPANAYWKINEIFYSNPADIEIPIAYCATELIRKDILVANTLNNIILISGVETSGIAIAPNIPIDTLLVTEIDVTDASIGAIVQPVTGTVSDYSALFNCTEAGNQTFNIPVGLKNIKAVLNDGRDLKKTYDWTTSGSGEIELYFDFEVNDKIYITGII